MEKKVKAALDSVVPDLNIGCFVEGKKRIHWHCKKADQVLLLFLDSLGKSKMSNFDHIDISGFNRPWQGVLASIANSSNARNGQQSRDSRMFCPCKC
jgi:hypothetical protein